MPVDLTAPIDLSNLSADADAMLADLQANILKGHGREHTSNLFFQFDSAGADAVKKWIKQIKVTSAKIQISVTAKHKKALKKSGGAKLDMQSPPVILVFLSASGYDSLGVPLNKTPQDIRFRAGQKSGQAKLNDPPVSSWDQQIFAQRIDAMILIGGEDAAQVQKAESDLLSKKPVEAVLLGKEIGLAYKNANRDGIEHFGYVDGRSQPLLTVQDIEKERNTTDGISVWNPSFPLSQAIVKDVGGESDNSFGSYFVFRKLEQNVNGFKEREDALADELCLKGDDRERAGALMVGRFEDGTPVVIQKTTGMHNPVPNNFDYRDDAAGLKCPFHSHIRKTNPRGESVRPGLASSLDEERQHIMVRRGITYGERKTKPAGKNGGIEFTDQPTGGVGLLFMAYQNDIATQFEFTQAIWANNKNFVNSGTGIDPVIGQGDAGGQKCPVHWGGSPDDSSKPFDFRGFVSMKGGEYFFAPSLSALKNL
jgi:Dyp-type peroxidase family